MRMMAIAITAATVVSACAQHGTTASLRPDPASGLMVLDNPAPDRLVPSFGVRSGNHRTTWQSLADATPAQIVPLFSRYRAARQAGAVPADDVLVLGARKRDALPTIEAGGANICVAIGAGRAVVKELPKDRDGVRQIGLRCDRSV